MSELPPDLSFFLETNEPLQWCKLQKATKLSIVKLARRAGVSATVVAQKLGTTRNAILGFAHREGLSTSEPKLAGAVATTRSKTRAKRKRGAGDKHLEKRLKNLAEGNGPKVKDDPAAAAQDAKAFEASEGAAQNYVELMDLATWHCRWPVVVNGRTLFCGKLAHESSPYCATHHNRAYLGGSR